jgi:hypothetical protein
MALQTSGQISLANIRTELGGSGQISMNDSGARGLIGASSGSELEMSDWYGASNGTDIRTSFYRGLAIYQIGDDSRNSSKPYSVGEVQQSYSGTGRLYIVHRSSGGAVAGCMDAPIGCVQVLNSAGTTVNKQWWFGDTAQSWQHASNEYNFGTANNLNITPANAASGTYTYSNIVDEAFGNARPNKHFLHVGSTATRCCGSNNGIYEPTGPMTVGEQTQTQQTAKNFIYREVSGSTDDYSGISRSPSRTWSAGEIIRVAYSIGNEPTPSDYDPPNTFHLGIY